MGLLWVDLVLRFHPDLTQRLMVPILTLTTYSTVAPCRAQFVTASAYPL